MTPQDQDPGSQHDALTEADCDKLFIDRPSGRLGKALECARADSPLINTRLSRSAHSLRNPLDLAGLQTELELLKQGTDTKSPTGRLMFHLFITVEEFQRELIVKGFHRGSAAAPARGRSAAMSEPQIHQARQKHDELCDDGEREFPLQQLAETSDASRATLYRRLDSDMAVPLNGGTQ